MWPPPKLSTLHHGLYGEGVEVGIQIQGFPGDALKFESESSSLTSTLRDPSLSTLLHTHSLVFSSHASRFLVRVAGFGFQLLL